MVPTIVNDTAEELVSQWYQDAAAENPDYHYSDWRVESLEYAYTYDDFDGMTLLVYRINYEFLSETPDDVVLAGGMTVTDDGWVAPSYPDCTYLIFRQDGSEPTLLKTMMENDCAPGDDLFTSDLRRALSYAPDALTADMSMASTSCSTTPTTISSCFTAISACSFTTSLNLR